MGRQGRIPHDAFDGEEKVTKKAKPILGDEHPVIREEDEDEEDLDPTYTGPQGVA
jgi:hypothetical protein